MAMIVHYDTVLYLAADRATILWAGRSEDRIPVWARFSGPLPPLPKAHPESCMMGTVSLSRGVNRPGRGVEPPPPSNAHVEY